MSNMTPTAKRYRLQVPAADESVQKWLAEQINISTSLRQLIRDDIQKNGFTDVTCRAVEQGPKRGRPTNAELERREEQKVQDAGTQTEQNVKQENEQTNQTFAQAQPVAVSQPDTKNDDVLASILG